MTSVAQYLPEFPPIIAAGVAGCPAWTWIALTHWPVDMSGDLDLDAVFGRSSPDDAFAAVLTEARMVLDEIASPLEAELWGSDILAALGGPASLAAQAMVPAAERSGSPEALAILRVLGALGWPDLRTAANRAAGGWLRGGSRTRPGRPRSGRRRWGSAGVTGTTGVSRRP